MRPIVVYILDTNDDVDALISGVLHVVKYVCGDFAAPAAAVCCCENILLIRYSLLIAYNAIMRARIASSSSSAS